MVTEKTQYAENYAMTLTEITILSLLITGNIHPNHLGLYSRNCCCYGIFIWFYQADTAPSPRCYCSISRINNRRFSSHNNPPAWTMHSLKSIHSHATLSHTDIYRLGASLCHSATSSITGKSVRYLQWVRNSRYCIEVLPRDTVNWPVLTRLFATKFAPVISQHDAYNNTWK